MPTVERDKLYVAAWIDPSGGLSQGKRHSRWAITVLGQDDAERVFILLSWAAHASVEYALDKMFKTQQDHKPTVFGMDASATQILFANDIRKESSLRGIPIPLKTVALKADKTFNIETTIQPVASQGRLFRPPEGECKILLSEFQSFPSGVYRDALDSLACCLRLLPGKASALSAQVSRDGYRRYLEKTGMSEDQIRRRLAARDEMK